MLSDRRCKILATIGPSTREKENLGQAIKAGMNAARLNFSHGTHEDHLKVLNNIRSLSEEMNAPVTIVQDLQGPKIRVGRFAGGQIELRPGETVTLTIEKVEGKDGLIPVDFPGLIESCEPGTRVLLDDGLLELKVEKVSDPTLEATVIYGGFLKDRKGVNVPGVPLNISCLTEKDLKDLEFGLAHNVDCVALSFVRRGSDIENLRDLIRKRKSPARVIAKIEMLEALDNLEEIIRASDMVMVARGDLAVEVGSSVLPGVQKKIIHLCNLLDKPVITATQMLDSMVSNPRPTRAEITDVANAVLDGSDCLMLSAETASGRYPFKCIRTMHDIILQVEKTNVPFYTLNLEHPFESIAETIGASASLAAMKLEATAIVCLTTSGKTATLISGFRPKCKIFAVTENVETLNKLELVWGLQTLRIDPYENSDVAMEKIIDVLLSYDVIHPGDKVVMTLGVPVTERGKTNAMRVYNVKEPSGPKLTEAEMPLRFKALAEEV